MGVASRGDSLTLELRAFSLEASEALKPYRASDFK